MAIVEWSQDTLTVAGTVFRLSAPGATAPARRGELVLLKPRRVVEEYLELVKSVQPTRIIELGVFQGGSTALLALLAQPSRLVAVELRERPPPALEAWVSERALEDVVRLRVGTDQADATRLRAIVAEEFGGQPVDLIIDDASHLPAPTRSSFNTLFPHLRPGGWFIIEDWARGHEFEAHIGASETLRAEAANAARRGAKPKQIPVQTPLMFEFLLAAAHVEYRDAIAQVRFTRDWAAIQRGTAELQSDDFDVAECYLGIATELVSRLHSGDHRD